MPAIKKPDCKDCGVVKTHENTGVQYSDTGNETFISRCFECDTTRSREYQWAKLSPIDLRKRLKKYRKYVSDLEKFLERENISF